MRQMYCKNETRLRGWAALSGVLIVTTVVWGVLLPQVAATESFQRKRDTFDEHGINASAVFYTDHPRWGDG